MKLLTLFILLLPSFKTQAQQTHASQKIEIMTSMSSLKNALLAKDSSALEKLLSNEVQYGHSNGMIETKKALIHSITSNLQDYKNIEPFDITLNVYSNTAVARTKLKINMLFNNKPLKLNLSVLMIWLKKENKWQLIERQAVELN